MSQQALDIISVIKQHDCVTEYTKGNTEVDK